MTTTPAPGSLPTPTPADLKRLPERPYGNAESKTAALIFAEFRAHGPRTEAQLVKTIGERRRRFVQNALQAMEERRHAAVETGDGERVYHFGPEYASIQIAATKAIADQPRGPLLRDLYFRSVRPKFDERYGRGHIRALDVVVRAIERWRVSTCANDIDAAWLRDFDLHMKSLGLSDDTRRNRRLYLCQIVREQHPYRFLTRTARWSSFEPLLHAERGGRFGNYYVKVYERQVPQTKTMKWHDRRIVTRFARWNGAPIELAVIDNDLLERFRKSEISRGIKRRAAMVAASVIRRVVNHWDPGRLATAKQPAAPNTGEGTVQHFVEDKFIPSAGFTPKTVQHVRSVMRDFHEFCGRRGLPFCNFTDDVCANFLTWLLTDRAGRKRQLSLETVNSNVRSYLVQISIAAKDAGLMKKRLFLEPIEGWKPKRRPSANGRPPASTNGASGAAKQQASAPAIAETARAARVKGGQSSRQWTPQVGRIAQKIAKEAGKQKSHRALCAIVVARLFAEGHEFSLRTVQRNLPKV